MFLQWLWFGMVTCSIAYAFVRGMGGMVLGSMLEGCSQAIEITLRMAGGYILFSGMMKMAQGAGISAALEKGMRPALRRLMPHMGSAAEAVCVNLSMNLLGMGNAATPRGIDAVRRLDAECARDPKARQDLYLFLILNATGVQLLPSTVITLRAAAGSADPGAIVLPTFLCTGISALAGVVCALICRRMLYDQ